MTTPSSHELQRCQSIIQELDSYTWSHGRRQQPACRMHAWFIKRLLLPWDNFRALIIKPGRCTRTFIRGPNDSHDTLVGNFVLPSLLFYFSFSRASVLLSLFPTRPTGEVGVCVVFDFLSSTIQNTHHIHRCTCTLFSCHIRFRPLHIDCYRRELN